MKKLNQTRFLKLPFLGDMAVSFGRTVFGIVLGLIASAVLIAISGVNPFLAYGALIRGAFGNAQALSNVLVRASPLLLGASAFPLASKRACGTLEWKVTCTWVPSALPWSAFWNWACLRFYIF